MNIHEYQAKQILKSYGAPVADGVAILKAEEAHLILAEALLSDEDVDGAKDELTQLLALVQSRGTELVDSQLQQRGRAGCGLLLADPQFAGHRGQAAGLGNDVVYLHGGARAVGESGP